MKKILLFIPFLISVMMGFISCSHDEEMIGDPPCGIHNLVEAVGDISQDTENLYFTVHKCLRVYTPEADLWDSAWEEFNVTIGKKLKINQTNENDSIILRKLTECVGYPVVLTTDMQDFVCAALYPERTSIQIKSVSEIDDNTRSIETEKDE